MKIVSIMTNSPIFVELQHLSLIKYFTGAEYEHIIFNDGKSWNDVTNYNDPEHMGMQAIERTCNEFGIRCINLNNEHHKSNRDASRRHADSLRILKVFMLENKDEYLILDGDMFLIDTLDIRKYNRKIYACVLQENPIQKIAIYLAKSILFEYMFH